MWKKTVALTLTLTAVTGCSLVRPALRHAAEIEKAVVGTPESGRLIAPKRCNLRFMIINATLKDEALNEVLWRVADEQTLDPSVRTTLEANGVRIGLVTGELPAEIRALIDAPPPHKVEPRDVSLPSGEPTLAVLSQPRHEASLLMNLEGQTRGRDYQDAKGVFRITATHEGKPGLTLRLVPEVHHGPIQSGVASLPTTSPFASQQFMFKNGQQEESFRDLAVTLKLQPNQVAVVGCPPVVDHRLGSFLFVEPEVNSDRLSQKVLLIWASLAQAGKPGEIGGPAGLGSEQLDLTPLEPPDLPGVSPGAAAKDGGADAQTSGNVSARVGRRRGRILAN